MRVKDYIDRLEEEEYLEKEQWQAVIADHDREDVAYAAEKARAVAHAYFGRHIYVRGLIEFTNYCRNNCYYCGIRRGNGKVERYRLTEEEIFNCCDQGYRLGLRTFVLQGGEDGWYTDERMEHIIRQIKKRHPDCAMTLSIGERGRESYRRLYEAGADRYLLRHETADESHYRTLHPPELSLAHRKDCLRWLKETGYQTGCGFMVGSPGQTPAALAEDMAWIGELHPHMIGIGPFLPHSDTPFAKKRQGSYALTLFLISLLRIMEKNVLLPATTALGTIHPQGREAGILAGANVLMPNLSPVSVREKYALYDNKKCTGGEAAECMEEIIMRMREIGYEVVTARGDWERRA